jgi:hypothetical protein
MHKRTVCITHFADASMSLLDISFMIIQVTKEVVPVDLEDLLHPLHAHDLLAKGLQPRRISNAFCNCQAMRGYAPKGLVGRQQKRVHFSRILLGKHECVCVCVCLNQIGTALENARAGTWFFAGASIEYGNCAKRCRKLVVNPFTSLDPPP